ncbi:MAG: glycosyltransferase family 9 protein [Candidatus Eremiobacteraeota bacterium]|nr:glycosyltransferase family 9 protein [Candidatus Eremiobacteraeota bacterium]
MPEVSPSVLIIRLDGIGDAVALTPLLAALRRRSIPVDIVLRDSNGGIFASRAARSIVMAPFALRNDSRSNRNLIAMFGHELASRQYSHVLVPTEDPAGYRLAAAVGAPVRIGFADPWGKPLKAIWGRRLLSRSVYRSAGLDPRGPHECEVLFTLGESLLGDESPTSDVAELRPLLLEREPDPGHRIAVQITDKWERIGIPVEHVCELLFQLREYRALQLLCAARESEYANRIAAASQLAIDYFDALEPWKEAIAAAPLIVTPDSGALHVAGMTGTPVVAIFPPQREYALQIARWAPWAAPHRIVRADGGWQRRATDAVAQLLAT